jgi:hypothetical protein
MHVRLWHACLWLNEHPELLQLRDKFKLKLYMADFKMDFTKRPSFEIQEKYEGWLN